MVTLLDLVSSSGVFVSLVCPIRVPVAIFRHPKKYDPESLEFGWCQFLLPLSVVQNRNVCSASLTWKTTCPCKFGECTLNMLLFFVTFRLVCPIHVPVAFHWPQKDTSLVFSTTCCVHSVAFLLLHFRWLHMILYNNWYVPHNFKYN